MNLKRPSVQLGQPEDAVRKREDIIQEAKRKYRALSRDIDDCAKVVRKIKTAVQLIVEAERQHKFAEDINATKLILDGVRTPALSTHSLSHIDPVLYLSRKCLPQFFFESAVLVESELCPKYLPAVLGVILSSLPIVADTHSRILRQTK
ncbi:hypothetical protein B0H13DRAFT_1913529 [Mycena leptocephala]|nr:hypothetical protein B0H13DRAFT_1913529 [Mycena leptocephala]